MTDETNTNEEVMDAPEGADIKRKEAFALDPSLEPKKGPGRPKKEA